MLFRSLWPDVENDRLRAQQIRDGREAEWQELTVAQIEDAGQQEMMTWICVAGAMHELRQKGDVIDYVEAGPCVPEKPASLPRYPLHGPSGGRRADGRNSR